MGVAGGRSGRRIPTKPVGGLLSDIGGGDPCLRLTGHAVPDRPESVLTSLPGPSSYTRKQAHTRATISTVQWE